MLERLLGFFGTPRSRRPLWRELHLWLGLGLGLPMAIFGITGSILVFWQEIDAGLNPDLYEIHRTGESGARNYELATQQAVRKAPAGWESAWASVPEDADTALALHFFYPQEIAERVGVSSLNVFVNPYDGTLLGTRVFYHPTNPFNHCFIGFIFKLHYALLSGSAGVTLVGAMAVLLFIGCLSGLILWWPLDRKWRRALTIKGSAGGVRLNHDIHQASGFYFTPVLIAVIVSGIYFNLPDEFRWLVERFSPLTPEVQKSGIPERQILGISVDTLLSQTSSAKSDAQLGSLSFNGTEWRVITACYRNVPELSGHFVPTRCHVLDRLNGELLQIQDPQNATAGDVFIQWQWPLHSGQALGWTGRILVFICGLLCALLFVTGLLRWNHRRLARKLSAERHKAKSAAS